MEQGYTAAPCRRALVGVAALLLAACAAQSARDTRTVPKDVADALLPPLGYGDRVPGRDAAQQRFDVNVRDVPAQAFFTSLVEGTPYNIVVQPGVGGTITLNLKNVTIQETMDHVREAFGYDYAKTPGGYTVLAEQMLARTFRVNYLNVKRTGKSRIFVSSGQLSERAGQAGAAAATDQSQRGTVPSSDIQTDTAADFWPEIEATVRTLVPEGGGRRLVINRDAGLIVARAMTSELRAVEGYLRTLQTNLTRQVILEAKIVEVQLNEGFQAGINWTAIGTNSDGYTAAGGQFGGQGVFEDGATDAAGASLINPVTGLIDLPIAPTAIGGAVGAVLNINDFNAVIEMLQGQGDVHVLSSPRVSTVNNQKAIIKVGSDEFFVTKVTANQTATGAGGAQQARTVEFTPFFSGIALDVTPQIDEQGTVTLHVHPSVSDVRTNVKTLEFGSGETETFPLALSNVREADSIVRARSGQIIVIGGLMQENRNDDRFGVPVLSRLPLIGFLFRQTRFASRKSELVILLKPIVIESDEQWAEEVRRRQLKVEEIKDDQRRWWN